MRSIYLWDTFYYLNTRSTMKMHLSYGPGPTCLLEACLRLSWWSWYLFIVLTEGSTLPVTGNNVLFHFKHYYCFLIFEIIITSFYSLIIPTKHSHIHTLAFFQIHSLFFDDFFLLPAYCIRNLTSFLFPLWCCCSLDILSNPKNLWSCTFKHLKWPRSSCLRVSGEAAKTL